MANINQLNDILERTGKILNQLSEENKKVLAKFERVVKVLGNSAYIQVDKKYLNHKVKIQILKEKVNKEVEE